MNFIEVTKNCNNSCSCKKFCNLVFAPNYKATWAPSGFRGLIEKPLNSIGFAFRNVTVIHFDSCRMKRIYRGDRSHFGQLYHIRQIE